MVEWDNPLSVLHRAKTIVHQLELQPGMTVLDIGCGPGRLTLPLAQAVGQEGKVYAIDLQPGMLRRVQAKALANNLANIQFLEIGMGEGRLTITQADRVVLVAVLGEIPNKEAALKEIFAALRPGGLLSVTEIILDPHYQRRDFVTNLTESAGFRVKACFSNLLGYTLHLQRQSE